MDKEKETELLQAAANGEEDRVSQLLDEGVSARCSDDAGRTPLHLAAMGGFMDTVCRLLGGEETQKTDVDVNAKDQNGNTALHLAAQAGYVGTARDLVGYSDIDTNATNNDHKTAVELAAENDHPDTVRFLLNEDATLIPSQAAYSHRVNAVLQRYARRAQGSER